MKQRMKNEAKKKKKIKYEKLKKNKKKTKNKMHIFCGTCFLAFQVGSPALQSDLKGFKL